MAFRKKHSASFSGYQRKMYHVGTYLPKKSCFSSHGGFQIPSQGGFFKTHGRPHSSVPEGPHMSHYGDCRVNHEVALYIFNHVGSCNLSNDYENPGKKKVGESHGGDIHKHIKTSASHGFLKDHGEMITNVKETMQLLNDRLSSYLGEIRILEQRNAQLEKKISNYQENSSALLSTDQSQFRREIQELQNQISSAISKNCGIVLQINNSRSALGDLNNKYEMERNLRSTIEADVAALHSIWEVCKEETGKLESEVGSLEQELLRMRRDSEQEINSLTTDLGPRVSVEVEAAKSKDLTKALSDIREHYENLVESNQREVESLFTQMTKELNHVIDTGSEEMQSVQSFIINLKSSMQIMEIELHGEQNLISSLQDTLAEKKAYFSSDINQMQIAINTVEDQLQHIRYQLQDLHETNKLLNKHNIQQEIATYHQLLDEIIYMEPPPLNKDHGQTQNEREEHTDSENAESF